MEKKEVGFSSKLGFILAAAGSAVGLGNIWRFPHLAAKYGGGTFLMVYLILVVTFGFTLMLTEIVIGRKTRKSVLFAFKELHPKWGFLGILAAIVPVIILPYYCVIGGWVTKYTAVYLTGGAKAAAESDYFNSFTSTTVEPLIWMMVFLVLTFVIVLMGVQKGIEKASKVIMPILLVFSIFLLVYVLMQPGATEGIRYYFQFDMDKLSKEAVFAAMGQMFYSMSLGMGIMITYGAHLNEKEDAESTVRSIELFDTGIAFLYGLIIISAVFVFSSDIDTTLSSGPKLMFITLPKVFEGMKGGALIGGLFFFLVLFAALTSSISIMETIVMWVQEKFHMGRTKACILVGVYGAVAAIPSSLGFGVLKNVKPLGYGLLDFFDYVSNSLIMPVVAFLTCVFIGYVMKPKNFIKDIKPEGKFKSEKLYVVMIKYLAPLFTLIILVTNIIG
ncbi:MAG: sodium-dependent transporter [Lachnospiraceae bacterium]|nr:sodium-dependent transporter [Lachnospiraceae bacterium]